MPYNLPLVGLTLLGFIGNSQTKELEGMAFIKSGRYAPLYKTTQEFVEIEGFYLDETAVTVAQYALFMEENPQWKKDNIKSLFAEESYLSNWEEQKQNPKAPITYVSWFAANAYCQSKNKRLPTIDEWEYVGLADENNLDARTQKSYNQYILDWYERPKSSTFPEVKSTFKNAWGIYDMHGLVWEWTLDFNAILISGESRKDGTTDRNLFCGSASIGAADLMNYAAFIRYAFRGSVEAKFAIKNLGFRCACDAAN
ncbi:MAG: formylglycine-generating enzyme family protein [Flavobacteriaceae bacterium]|jgi:formylglycine-generating enzyme required for sulfatase activity